MMARKGDFEECKKCTSFQCGTCGLDQGLLRTKGNVSVSENIIGCNVIALLFYGYAYYKGNDLATEWEIIISVIAFVFATLLLSKYVLLKQDGKEVSEEVFWCGIMIDFSGLCLYIYALYESFINY